MVYKVICIDGGGTKGIFSFEILKRLKACEIKVDLIVGVSVGAVVGAMYASGCLDKYTDDDVVCMAKSIFPPDLPSSSLLFKTKYNGVAKLEVLKKMFGNATFNSTAGGCLNIHMVVPVESSDCEPIFLDSRNGAHNSLMLYDVLNATTAVPLLFPPVNLLNKVCFDGGTITSSPLTLAYLYALKLGMTVDVIRVISIGTVVAPLIEGGVHKSDSSFGLVKLAVSTMPRKLLLRGGNVFNDMVASILGDNLIVIKTIVNNVVSDVDGPTLMHFKQLADEFWKKEANLEAIKTFNL